MSVRDFKIWLAQNELTQRELAARLGISANTITTYVKNERFPIMFQLALISIENILRGKK